MKTCIAFSIGALAWLVAGANPAAAQALRYGAEPGTTHTYVRTQQDSITQTVSGAETTTELRRYWRFEANINGGEGTGRTVEVVHDSLAVSIGSQAGPDLSVLYGEPTRIVMDDRGTVTEVVLPDSIPASASQLDLATTYRGFFPVLPPEPVVEGGSWTDTVNVRTNQNGLDMTIQRISHYTARGNAEFAGYTALQIDYTAEVAIEGSGSQPGADISLSGEGTETGTFYFLPDPGVYLGGSDTSEARMDAFVVAGGQNLVIPIVQKGQESIELVN